MRTRLVALLALAVVPLSFPTARAADAAMDCVAAASRAETEAGLPPGLLLSIGRIESGRYDPRAGGLVPWPFAVNIAGRGAYPASRDAAVGLVAAELASGVRSIDVGCFQINLHHHPTAFATLEQAFDAEANAQYAARFLRGLYARTGSWPMSVGLYHSADPVLGGLYSGSVLRDWTGQREPGAGLALAGGTRFAPMQLALRVRVVLPSWATAEPSAASAVAQLGGMVVRSGARGRLPRVVTPTFAAR